MANVRYDFPDFRGDFKFKIEDDDSLLLHPRGMKTEKIIYISIGVVAAVFVMGLLFCLCRRRQRKNKRQSVLSQVYSPPPINYGNVDKTSETMPERSAPPLNPYQHNRISSVGDRFAVPLDLLPPAFDFSAPGVEHKGTYILVKDLDLVSVPNRDEYQIQQPYNPNFA